MWIISFSILGKVFFQIWPRRSSYLGLCAIISDGTQKSFHVRHSNYIYLGLFQQQSHSMTAKTRVLISMGWIFIDGKYSKNFLSFMIRKESFCDEQYCGQFAMVEKLSKQSIFSNPHGGSRLTIL